MKIGTRMEIEYKYNGDKRRDKVVLPINSSDEISEEVMTYEDSDKLIARCLSEQYNLDLGNIDCITVGMYEEEVFDRDSFTRAEAMIEIIKDPSAEFQCLSHDFYYNILKLDKYGRIKLFGKKGEASDELSIKSKINELYKRIK